MRARDLCPATGTLAYNFAITLGATGRPATRKSEEATTSLDGIDCALLPSRHSDRTHAVASRTAARFAQHNRGYSVTRIQMPTWTALPSSFYAAWKY
jgi:hypothetical protein